MGDLGGNFTARVGISAGNSAKMVGVHGESAGGEADDMAGSASGLADGEVNFG